MIEVILRKKIIGLLGSVSDNSGLLREEIAKALGTSVYSVDEAAAGLVECGLLRVDTVPSRNGCRYFLGKSASMVVIIRERDGIRLSARYFDGEEIQRKYIARNFSLTLREDADSVAASLEAQIRLLLEENPPCIFGVMALDEELGAWERIGAELAVGEDVYPLALELSLASRKPDIFVRVKDGGVLEVSVMRRGEEIVSRRAFGREKVMGMVELISLFESDNFTLAFDKGLEDEAAELLVTLQTACDEQSLCTNFVLDSDRAKEELFFKILRNRLCDKAFKLKRDSKKRRT